MALTVDQIKPILAKKLDDAINARLNPANRKGSMQRIADEIGVDLGTLKGWVYGENLPSSAGLIALIAYFGNGAQDEIMADFTGNRTVSQAEAALEELEDRVVSLVEESRKRRVEGKGRVE